MSSQAVSIPVLYPSVARSGGWQLFFRAAVIPFIVTRAMLIAVAFFAIDRLPGARAVGWDLPTSSTSLNMWSHFDGRWYLAIARDGYHWIPNQQNGVAFAPLYPMLMRLLGNLAGGSDQAYLIAGLVISNVALLIAIGYMTALLLLDGHDQRSATRAGWYVLIFPTSLFLSAVYPMSLFMALAAAALYHARKGQWNLVGILTGLAALSRPDGVLLTAALAVEYWMQRGFSFHRDLLPLALGPIATMSWMAFQWRQFGNPLAFVEAQKQWSSCPITTVLHSPHGGLQLGPTALFVLLAALAVFKLRPSLSAFSIIMLAVMLWADRYWSITRFLLVLFPAFMMLGILGRRYKIVHLLYTSISVPLAVILMMRFALTLWVA
jgi:Mannosyltransferase (PIG-V)